MSDKRTIKCEYFGNADDPNDKSGVIEVSCISDDCDVSVKIHMPSFEEARKMERLIQVANEIGRKNAIDEMKAEFQKVAKRAGLLP